VPARVDLNTYRQQQPPGYPLAAAISAGLLIFSSLARPAPATGQPAHETIRR